MIVLNLGSGDIPAPPEVVDGGQEIMVDIVPPADVIADCRDLPFEDEYADVIYSSHLIEHFDEHDVIPMVAEWRRVLKTGGKLQIECPDIQSAAQHIWRNGVDEVLYSLSNGVVVRGQDLIFGYQPWVEKQPAMRHKVAYDMKKLCSVLEQAGFSRGSVEQHYEAFALRAIAFK